MVNYHHDDVGDDHDDHDGDDEIDDDDGDDEDGDDDDACTALPHYVYALYVSSPPTDQYAGSSSKQTHAQMRCVGKPHLRTET